MLLQLIVALWCAPVAAQEVPLPASHSSAVIHVLAFGAKPGEPADDRSRLQAAIDAASAMPNGAEVQLGPGTYRLSGYLTLKSKARVVGAGSTATRLILDYQRPTRAVTTAPGISDFELRGLTIEASTVVPNQTLLYLDGARHGQIEDVRLTGGTFAGIFMTRCADLAITKLHVDNVRQYVSRVGALGGTGIWLFKGNSRILLDQIAIKDVDISGLVIDAGTNDGVALQNSAIAIRNLSIDHFAQGDNDAGGAGINFQGGEQITVDDFRISSGSVRHASYGIFLEQDQSGMPCAGNAITNGQIESVAGPYIRISGASANTVDGVTLGPNHTSRSDSSTSAAIEVSDPPWVLPGRPTLPSEDNRVRVNLAGDMGGRIMVAWRGRLSSQRRNTVIATSHAKRPVSCLVSDPEGGRVEVDGPNANVVIDAADGGRARCAPQRAGKAQGQTEATRAIPKDGR